MAGDSKLSGLNPRGTPDRANDQILVVNGTTDYRSTINNELGISGNPVGDTDSQTLTNKTLTSPTISGPTFSGTLIGTYTIGGTPTFPASVVTLTGSQTLTNKTLTSPTITSPTITNASVTQDSVVGFTTANSGTVYGVAFTAGTISGASITANSITYSQVTTGFCVQQVNVLSSAVATGTTTIPLDNTLPQNTEGDQYMTVSITPKASTNILEISIVAELANSSAGYNMIMALFQDSNVNALAATAQSGTAAGQAFSMPLVHTITAGTTSSTTFKVRAGTNVGGTTTFNGAAATQYFSTATKSTIIIREYKV